MAFEETIEFRPLDKVEQLMEYAHMPGNEYVKQSIAIIEKCLNELNYDVTKFCISFNGGKDCTALLHLVYCVYMKHVPIEDRSKIAINALYIEMPETFEELKHFMNLAVKCYNLKVLKVEGPDYKKALKAVKADTEGQRFSMIFMGSRATDKTNLTHVQDTDADWPLFTRVSPMLHWSYHQVWSFLRDNQVPYCSLYDQGYTSLGQKTNTFRNPKLRVVSATGEVTYLPAYMLKDGFDERSFRV
ncbi:hypothetical protein B4U79_00111 [Dinothrombium tinctorium]|uniref:FAD synthase n=1 Tax=Dinothrombium tinctorium TaxID=1965070 RepID=A0A443QWV4_9ACAR|nr:hypothetical protein B4U79_00111 [Dinothrombium tinctorium]